MRTVAATVGLGVVMRERCTRWGSSRRAIVGGSCDLSPEAGAVQPNDDASNVHRGVVLRACCFKWLNIVASSHEAGLGFT